MEKLNSWRDKIYFSDWAIYTCMQTGWIDFNLMYCWSTWTDVIFWNSKIILSCQSFSNYFLHYFVKAKVSFLVTVYSIFFFLRNKYDCGTNNNFDFFIQCKIHAFKYRLNCRLAKMIPLVDFTWSQYSWWSFTSLFLFQIETQ